MNTKNFLKDTKLESNEIILALVQPVGTDLSGIRQQIEEASKKVGALFYHINLTDLISKDLNPRVEKDQLFQKQINPLLS